jgi:hypothetical protein
MASGTSRGGPGLDELFETGIVRMIRGSDAGAAEGTAHYRIPMSTRHEPPRRLLVNLGATPLRDSHGAVVGSIVIVEDISTRVSSRSSCRSRRRWPRSACSRPAWRTRSTRR